MLTYVVETVMTYIILCQGSGELLAKEAITPSILLNPNATLSPADFERKWLNMKLRYVCVVYSGNKMMQNDKCVW